MGTAAPPRAPHVSLKGRARSRAGRDTCWEDPAAACEEADEASSPGCWALILPRPPGPSTVYRQGPREDWLWPAQVSPPCQQK